jgi:hypothetical protein
MKPPDAIIVGDIHARDDQPPCRIDDFWETQKQKFLWLKDLWEGYGRPVVLQPGDLFHRWKSSPQVINAVLNWLPPMTTIPGNPGKHNYYNMEGFERDALCTVELSNRDWIIGLDIHYYEFPGFTVYTTHWGSDIHIPNLVRPILLTHRMILDGPAMFDGEQGLDFLNKYSWYNLIITGHNHKPMLFNSKDGRILVNPGSFTRQTAAETHKPRVYLWWAKDNRIEVIHVPIQEDAITREHLEEKEQRDSRIAAFVESLADGNYEVSTSFRDNMEARLGQSGIREVVKTRIREAMGDGN